MVGCLSEPKVMGNVGVYGDLTYVGVFGTGDNFYEAGEKFNWNLGDEGLFVLSLELWDAG